MGRKQSIFSSGFGKDRNETFVTKNKIATEFEKENASSETPGSES